FSRYALSEKVGRRPCLFPFLVKWETRARTLARVCSLFWCFGKQEQEHLPAFVPIFGVSVNKRGIKEKAHCRDLS
ncbi:hypothetical protein, partial [Gardnerella vaginalis]